MMQRYLDQPIEKLIAEEDLSQLLQELTDASGIEHRALPLHFVPFLNLCEHPMGASSKLVPLHPLRTRPGYLETQIEKLGSASISKLCEELAAVIHEPLEMHVNRKLMTFFNHVVRQLERQSKRTKRRH
jgi:hypothetical protein